MELKDIKSVYFVGIGGIGMSAIARYFLHMGVPVGGYDKTPSALTAKLEEEGAQIHYEDDLTQVPQIFLSPESTLVVYTPAIPSSHSELTHFFHHGFTVQKRAQVLGTLSQSWQARMARPPPAAWRLIFCIRVMLTVMLSWAESPRITEPIIS